ncbi:MAG: DNA repair protein RecO [Bacteroidales bacterium]|nr:DNA repair protein RecO [Bacteroidales bacterium]
MLHSTQGIVFHSIKYSETSVIVKIYTELFGIQSYLFRGVRSPRSRIKSGLFQPLTLLDMVVYHKEKQTLHSVKEIRLAYPYHSIPFDIRKSSVTLFLNELLYHSIREEEPNPELFAFIRNSCMELDSTTESVAAFHLFFALQLCHHLGIFPQLNYCADTPVFNLREGQFQAYIPDHTHYLDATDSKQLYHLLCLSGQGLSVVSMKPETRNHILDIILLYYKLHLPGFKGVESHHILHGVFS